MKTIRLEDEFVNTSWTLEGRLGALDVIYAGAFTDRESNQRIDYTIIYLPDNIFLTICTGEVTYTT